MALLRPSLYDAVAAPPPTVAREAARARDSTRGRTAVRSNHASAAAGATHQAAGASAAKVVHLTQTFDDFYNVDVAPEGTSLGDQFGAPVSWQRGSKVVATVGFTCTQTRLGDSPEDLCILSARFDQGVLTAQTLFEEQSTAPTDWAITGGTGIYRDAGGYLIVRNPEVTLHISNLGSSGS
jgi:hypothetical protein